MTSICEIDGNIFRNNTGRYSGAIFELNNVKQEVKNCVFEGNVCSVIQNSYCAAALHINASGDSVIENCTFGYNKSYGGGSAVYTDWSTRAIFKNCIFIGNSSVIHEDDPYTSYNGRGGAVYVNNLADFYDCEFLNNYAVKYGGAIFAGGSALISVNRCNFIGNHSTWYGGAIYCDGDLTVGTEGESDEDACLFENNYVQM